MRLGVSQGRVQGSKHQARRGAGGHSTQTPCTHAEVWPGPQGGQTNAQRTSRHQDSEEQQGHPPQTVIIINIFSLNYMMCVKGGWEEKGREKEETYVQEDEGGRDTPDEYGSESEDMGWGRGRRQRWERREDSRRGPEHAELLVPTK